VSCRYLTTPTETHSQALKRKFDALETRHAALEDLFQLLQSKPEQESLELLRRIRAGHDAESVISHATDGNLLLQLALVPETKFRYQFPYVRDMPLFLQTPDNPYLDSVIYEWTVGAVSASRLLAPGQTPRKEDNIPSPYLKPFHAAVLVDPVLDSARPSRWTNVSAGDELMRDLLATYFLREHMWFTYINKNLFLEDMASGSTEFCSSLLVNAVLAFACVCNPLFFSFLFFFLLFSSSFSFFIWWSMAQSIRSPLYSAVTGECRSVWSTGILSTWDTSSSPKQRGYGSSSRGRAQSPPYRRRCS
jgi:hypothetical protein